jgi:hypothetical protein
LQLASNKQLSLDRPGRSSNKPHGYPKRLPKGHGAKLIVQALAALPFGQGLKMTEIEERTGVNHATVFRTLRKMKYESKAEVEKGAWRLAPNKN